MFFRSCNQRLSMCSAFILQNVSFYKKVYVGWIRTASQTLIGQEAPPAYRGSVVGMFSMFGAAGILFISSAGGWVFDRIGPAAPFVLIGVANAMLFAAALVVARKPPATDRVSGE